MYIYYQPNPRGANALRCDCAIRAVARFFELTWIDALKKIFVWAEGACSSSDDILTFKYGMKHEKFSYKSFKGEERTTVEGFCVSHPKGRYLLRCEKKHWVTVVDGNVYDCWDSSTEKVNSYFYEES